MADFMAELLNSPVGIVSYQWQKFVCADEGLGHQLIADRDWYREWERFTVENLGGSKIALKAYNGRYVCAEQDRGWLMYANRDAIGPWETFEVYTVRPPAFGDYGEFGLKNMGSGCWVCADGARGNRLVADREAYREWEQFHWWSGFSLHGAATHRENRRLRKS
jgi:hypothetical protein